jgi:hypothetical protein
MITGVSRKVSPKLDLVWTLDHKHKIGVVKSSQVNQLNLYVIACDQEIIVVHKDNLEIISTC